ncbi:FAD-dependent oxidoreductase [Glutamicibacter sp. NPDC087344]|uniref:FAD-dependent oxidoreductase n=1 Tax=Glutamicibacter sp. NPDC087344 TaxID=3363994 RepID=UPI00382AD68F
MIADYPVIVIGAGPIGLSAATHLRLRKQNFVVLEAGDAAGATMKQWAHIKLFSPWKYNVDPQARRLLETSRGSSPDGWEMPRETSLPTGGELVDRYLRPLAAHPGLSPSIHYQHRVLNVSRIMAGGQGLDKTRKTDRDRSLFLVRTQTPQGIRDLVGRAVIDASGTWETSNPIGRAGLSAPGESEARALGKITSPLPDPLGADRERFMGKTVLVLGAGHSAANTLIALGRLKQQNENTRILWGLRGAANPVKLYGGAAADQLPARGQLGISLRRLVDAGHITIVEDLAITGIRSRKRIDLESADGRELSVDYVVPATGFRPALGMLSELRLDLDPAVEAPKELGPLIDPEFHSCGTVSAHGESALAHPEQNFYIVGAKSYGRAPTFLMATGYEQVRSVVAHLAGDFKASLAVELRLPETGVCSTGRDGARDEPAGEISRGSLMRTQDNDRCQTAQQTKFGVPTGTLHGFTETQAPN